MFDVNKVLASVQDVVDTVLEKVDVAKASATVLLNSTDAWIEAVNNNVDVQTAGKIIGEATLLLIRKTASGEKRDDLDDVSDDWWNAVADNKAPKAPESFKSFFDGL